MSKKQMSKKHWKGFAAAVACLLVAGIAMPSFAASPFRDVPKSHWGYSAIEEAYRDGAIGGTSYNEATGVREFSPEAPVTMAQFVNIMVRAFYPGENASGDKWYSAAVLVGKNHNLFRYAPPANLEKPMTRYDMAGMVYAILEDKGLERISDEEYQATAARISDYDAVTARARSPRAVVTVFSLGIIGGVDSTGRFSGLDTMTRAQAASVYVRLKSVVDKLESGAAVSPAPSLSGTSSEPSAPSNANATEEKHYGPVGTMSNEKVTLSLETHRPVVDYWSQQSAGVQSVADRDVFNATVQSMKDAELILSRPLAITGLNEYYNYACYDATGENAGRDRIYSVLHYIQKDFYNIAAATLPGRLPSTTGFCFTTIQYDAHKAELEQVLSPIYARFTPGMSDKEKVSVIVGEMVDRFDYDHEKTSVGFDWLNDSTKGVCMDWSLAFEKAASGAGIPVMHCNGPTNEGNHAWSIAYLDGAWYVVDATGAESGWPAYMSFEEHANLWGYSPDKYNDNTVYGIAMALVEAAWG